MKKWTLLIAGLFFAFMANAQWIIEDNEVEMRSEGTPFHTIKVEGNVRVYLSQDKSYVVAVGGKSTKQLSGVMTKVENGVLSISGGSADPSKVYIAFSDLEKLKASGKVDIQLTNKFKGKELKLDLSGIVRFKGEVYLDKLKTDISGVSKVILLGEVKELKLECSGTSQFTGPDIVVHDADIEASGASTVEVAEVKNLKAEASGTSKIYYHNNPVNIKKEVSGLSKIERKSK